MIKKEYIKPSVKAVKIQLNNMVMASMTDSVTGTKFDSDDTTSEMDNFDADFEEDY